VATHPPARRRRPPNSPFTDPVLAPIQEYSVDDRVSHDSFGLGRVVSVQGDTAVVVDFGSRTVRIPTPFPKLHKL